jgi:hypothetical protein
LIPREIWRIRFDDVVRGDAAADTRADDPAEAAEADLAEAVPASIGRADYPF